MAIKSGLPFLPNEGIIFLDNCAFNRDDYIFTNIERKYHSPAYLKKEIVRLTSLKTQLSVMDNWCTIKEVIEEFIDGNRTFNYKIKSSNCIQREKALKNLLEQRKETLQILNQEHVIADNSIVNELEDIIKEITPQIEQKFNMREGKTNKKRTDIKLISLALAYARQDYSFIFSQDQALLKTFSDCARDLYLYPKTYVISDRFKTPIPTQSYNEVLRRVRENPNTHKTQPISQFHLS
ncbi:MAG: hypothetical protein PHH54_02155 [Candidatus Nanoarchaeia archaeon]|nr:hypothetical protein [Candidatus Nanoarchaeia archaeon]MDD5740765.1 hypothetical protein [Candidatus Nanoarchaeia archaeon]